MHKYEHIFFISLFLKGEPYCFFSCLIRAGTLTKLFLISNSSICFVVDDLFCNACEEHVTGAQFLTVLVISVVVGAVFANFYVST